MTELSTIVTTRLNEDELAEACGHIMDAWLASLRGVRGFTIRSSVAAARRSRPDLEQRAAARVLPEMLDALDPMYARWTQEEAHNFAKYLVRHEAEAMDALLALADRRIEKSSNRIALSIYDRLRPSAADDMRVILPILGALVDRALAGADQRT